MKREKVIMCSLLAVLLCLGLPRAYAEEFMPDSEIWEEMPVAEDEAFFDVLFFAEDEFFEAVPEAEPEAFTEDEFFFDEQFLTEDEFFEAVPEAEPEAFTEDEFFFDEQFLPEDEVFEAVLEAEPEEEAENNPQSAYSAEDTSVPGAETDTESDLILEGQKEPASETSYTEEDTETFDMEPETEPESAPELIVESEQINEPDPEPSFTLITPDDLSIVFGVETQSIGFVFVSDVTDMPEGARILLYIDDPAFVNVDDPYETIPLAITDEWGNNVICLYDEVMGEQAVELYIHVGAEDWNRAALGTYAATISYRAVVA